MRLKPVSTAIAEIFGRINYHQCGKGCHIFYMYTLTNTGQRKNLPMRAGGKIVQLGKNFLLTKISAYTAFTFTISSEKFISIAVFLIIELVDYK